MKTRDGRQLGFLGQPGTWISLVAVVLASAGTAVAASMITGANVRNSTLTGVDVRNRSLTKKDFRGSVRGPRGPRGPQGPQGLTGPAGPAGPATGAAGGALTGSYPDPQLAGGVVGASELGTITDRVSTSVNVPPNNTQQATATCAPGEEVLSGGATTGGPPLNKLAIVAEGSHLFPGDPPRWTVYLANNDNSTAATLIAHAYCLAP